MFSRNRDVKIGIKTLAENNLPRNRDAWTSYVASAQGSLEMRSDVIDSLHGGKDPGVVSVLGWDTRELRLSAPPAIPGAEAYVQIHVVAYNETTGVAFVLMGTQSQVEAVEQDLRFFLSRISRSEKPAD